MREGPVTRHYLKCPFCPGSMDLDSRRCAGCGARAVAVLWEHDSPELAMVARRHPPDRIEVAPEPWWWLTFLIVGAVILLILVISAVAKVTS